MSLHIMSIHQAKCSIIHRKISFSDGLVKFFDIRFFLYVKLLPLKGQYFSL